MAEQKKRGQPPKEATEKPKRKTEKTSEKQKAPDKMLQFAEEYIIDFNGTRAYKAVYGETMSDAVAASSAWRLLRNEKVCNETERLLADVKNRRNERKARVLKELEVIAYNHELDEMARLRGLELLGKTEALFTDKVEQTGPIDINVNFNPKGI